MEIRPSVIITVVTQAQCSKILQAGQADGSDL